MSISKHMRTLLEARGAKISLIFTILMVSGLGVFAIWLYQPPPEPITMRPPIQNMSSITIDSTFTLVDTNNNIRTTQDFRGQYMLVFFGFTNCPDVCPLGLQTIGIALDQMPDEAKAKIAPIFITIDPARDTPSVIAQYLENFHPLFVGLTGTNDQIAVTARHYKVFHQKVMPDDMEHYMMAHSSIIYVIGREGEFVRHFDHNVTASDMATVLTSILTPSK